jgi:hypothetical protein
MNIVIVTIAVVAASVWLLAIVTGIRLMRRLSGRLSPGAMMVRGIAWFDMRNFKPEATGLHRTFLRTFAGFFACIFALAIAAVLGGDKA